MTIMFLSIFHFSTNAKQKLRNLSKNFFYRLTAELPTMKQQNAFYICFTTPANSLKNSTEAIYERNPQLLSCQPNKITRSYS